MKKTAYIGIAVMLLLAACAKKDTTPSSSSTGTGNNTVNINSTPQCTATISGTNYSYVNGSTYTSGVSDNKQLGGSSATANYGEYQSNIYDAATYTKGVGVWKGTITFPLSSNMPDTTTFYNFFAPKSYPYSVNYTNGIEVDWTDNTGTVWTTSQGTGVQTGSNFTITAEKSYTILGYYNVKVVANFNCTLYNSAGNSVTLTNGVYVGYFEND